MLHNFRVIIFFLVINIITISSVTASTEDSFDEWLTLYKKSALKQGISQETLDIALKNVKFLDQVIKFDRKQPEFYEDTITYVNKTLFSFSNFFAILALELLALLFTYVIVSS